MHRFFVSIFGVAAFVTPAFAPVAAAQPATDVASSPPVAAPALPSTASPAGPRVGAPAPAFSLHTIDGKTVTLEKYRGKTLLINVWATWCPPCRGEMPLLASSYPTRGAGVEYLGVDTTEAAPIVRTFVAAKNVGYPQAIDTDQTFAQAYDVRYFPTTYVVDAQGILRARFVDELRPQVLASLIRDGRDGRDAVIVSAQQTKIDALLGAPVAFDGDAASVTASAKKVRETIADAEALADEDDASKVQAVDFFRTQSEEAALRGRAIDALAKVASTPEQLTVLGLLRGDAAAAAEQYEDALTAYRSVLAIDPKNTDALSGVAVAAGRLERYTDVVDADVRLSSLAPNDVDPLVDLGIALGRSGKFSDAYATFQTAVTLARRHVDAAPHDAKARRKLAWTLLYDGRTHAKGGDVAAARTAFRESMRVASALPPNDERHDMYLEEDQEALVALDLASGRTGTTLSLAPWTGPELPGSVPNTIKYRLAVAGSAGRTVMLRTAGLPHGWVASFCTDRICAPFRVSVQVPPSGVKVIEFQVIPLHGASRGANVRVIGNDGATTATAST